MRIISKYHDYYDVLNDGSDTDHVWRRETSSFFPNLNDPFYKTEARENELPYLMDNVSVPQRKHVLNSRGSWQLEYEHYRRSLLLFCGEFYQFVKLADRICWDFDSFAQAINLEERPYSKRGFRTSQQEVYAKVQAMFTQETILPRFKTLNLRLKCPIVLMEILEEQFPAGTRRRTPFSYVQFTLNPHLDELGFASIIPPYDAFLRLETYLFNDLAEQKDPPIEISDNIKRDMHGFDKHSFQKDPTKKK
ncbi:MAG: hypothetical protein IJT83_05325 [Victivallales bacterium]|nr:hypothetical protein [Victivallales bacterium]